MRMQRKRKDFSDDMAFLFKKENLINNTYRTQPEISIQRWHFIIHINRIQDVVFSLQENNVLVDIHTRGKSILMSALWRIKKQVDNKSKKTYAFYLY